MGGGGGGGEGGRGGVDVQVIAWVSHWVSREKHRIVLGTGIMIHHHAARGMAQSIVQLALTRESFVALRVSRTFGLFRSASFCKPRPQANTTTNSLMQDPKPSTLNPKP